jgi:GNAT superfamily N-acetyltransferase
MNLRKPEAVDLDSICALLAQLGHSTQPEQVRIRLDRLRDDPNFLVLVGERDGRVVGLVVAYLTPLLEREPSCRITALVVDQGARRSGMAAMLTAAVEDWARERSAFRVELTSADHRADAHAFYAAMGYRERSKRFVKELG